jgi:hypothetical protein
MAINRDYAGRRFKPSDPYEVSRVKIAEFAHAIGDQPLSRGVGASVRDPQAGVAVGARRRAQECDAGAVRGDRESPRDAKGEVNGAGLLAREADAGCRHAPILADRLVSPAATG